MVSVDHMLISILSVSVVALAPQASDLKACPDYNYVYTLSRQLATVSELLPETLLHCFVLEIFISLVVQLLTVLHTVHNRLLVGISKIDVSCIVTVMVPPLLQLPLFQCHFFLSWAFFLCDSSTLASSILACPSLCCCCCASSLSLVSLSCLFC